MRLSIVIPAYNEAQRLPETLKTILSFFSARTESVEIVVVDDGSTDGTAAVAKSIDASIRVISHPRNMGKGAAVRSGMLAAQGDYRYLCDADLSTPIAEIDHFLTAAQTADIVIGSRRAPGARVEKSQAWWKVWFGKLGNLYIQALVAPGIHDSQCGFKLFGRQTMEIFEQQLIQRWGYDFELIFLARQHRFRIVELPVTWVNDARSTVRWYDYFRTLSEVLQVRLNHLRGRYKQQKP